VTFDPGFNFFSIYLIFFFLKKKKSDELIDLVQYRPSATSIDGYIPQYAMIHIIERRQIYCQHVGEATSLRGMYESLWG
jgi:hypothetical protein